MRGNSDLSSTYPFDVSPVNGWGNPNPDKQWVISFVPDLGKSAAKVTDGKFELVPRAEATRYDDPSDAAIASADVAEWYQEIAKAAG